MATFGAASDKDKKIGILDRLEDLLESITGSNKETGEGVLSVVPNLTTAQQEDMRYLKEQGGSQFTEKEAMRQQQVIQSDSVDEQFGRVLSAMPVWQQESVINFITSQGMTPAQITKFKQEVLLGNISPYELENLQTNQSTQSNLGLSNDQYAQGSQLYNHNLGIFMPSSFEGGYSGRTGDERFHQTGGDFSGYPHNKRRNYFGERMTNPRFLPLKLGSS
jgi:hypothetical protein